MNEIRIVWKPGIEHDDGVFYRDGKWYADAIEIRGALALIVTAQNERHGKNSHWIERRATPSAW